MTTLAVFKEIPVTDQEIRRRLDLIGFFPEDRERIQALKDLIDGHADDLVASFFRYLSVQKEASPLFDDLETLETATDLKKKHLRSMVRGDFGLDYAEERLDLGTLYAKVGLDPRVFLGGYSRLMDNIGTRVHEHFKKNPGEGVGHLMSLMKVAFFDVSLIMDVIIIERERIIRQQQEAIRELSTPALPLREGLLFLPIIGAIDSRRAWQLTEHLLHAIRTHRTQVVVVDVTGVPSMDSHVAQHLVQTVLATRLLGARMLVSGLSSQASATFVSLGIAVDALTTFGDLRGAIEEAETELGYTVTRGRFPNGRFGDS